MEKHYLGFYSHNYKIFNTSAEILQYELITRNFKGFVINPNKHLSDKNPFVLNQYWQVINKIDFLVVTPFHNKIDRASYYEVKQSLARRIPVFELVKKQNSYSITKVIGIEVINEKNLSAYAKLITDSRVTHLIKTH